jgi:hypothetical protein
MVLFTCFAKNDRQLSKFLQYASQRHCASQFMVMSDNDYRAGISRMEQMIADRQEPELDSEKDSLFNREILNKIEEGSGSIIELRDSDSGYVKRTATEKNARKIYDRSGVKIHFSQCTFL